MKKLIKRVLLLLFTIRDNTAAIRQQNDELAELFRNSMICEKEYLSKREAALYMDATISYIDTMIRNKSVPVYAPTSNAKYLRRKDIDNFIASNKILSLEEINARAAMFAKKK